jgi:hypothetical protein
MDGKSVVEGLKEYLAKPDPGFESAQVTIDQMISAGDKVVLVWTMTAMRNGKQVSQAGMEIDRLEDGKIVESWGAQGSPGRVPAARRCSSHARADEAGGPADVASHREEEARAACITRCQRLALSARRNAVSRSARRR